MRKNPSYLAPVAILLIAWAVLLINLGNRWLGHQDINGLVWSMSVRNFYLYGADTLRFAQVFQAGPASPSDLVAYTHHPPLITWLLGLASIPFGLNEAAFRFVAACLTLINTSALYVLARRLYGERIAGFAMAFYAFTPMLMYFGRMPNHEALSLAVCVSFAAVLVNWLREPTSQRWIGLAALAALAAWSAWSAMFYIALFLVAVLVVGSRRHRIGAVGIGVAFAVALVGLGMLTLWQRPDALQDITSALAWRTSTDSFMPGSEPFTTGQFIATNARHIVTLATPSLIILAGIGIMAALKRGRIAAAILGALIAHGLIYTLVLRNASYVHDYYKIFLIPPMALAGAVGFVRGWDRGRARRWLRPALTGLLFAWMLAGGYVFLSLHQSGSSADAEFMIEAFSEHTDQDDEIMTNLPYVTDAIEYYSFRNITWEVTPETVLDQGEDDFKYLYCGDESDMGELAEYPKEDVPPCIMVEINR